MPDRTTRAQHRTLIASGTVALAVLLATVGCANRPGGAIDGEPPLPPDSEPAAQVDCRSEGSWWFEMEETPDPSIPVPGRIPEGFAPSAALLCSVEEMSFVDLDPVEEGGSEAEVEGPMIEVQRHEGDFGPLLAALAEPDDPIPADLFCTADMELVPPLWLEGTDGRVVPVHYPRDACGKTKPAVRDALEQLEVTEVTRWVRPDAKAE